MSTIRTTYDDPALGGKAIARDHARALLGQVMGFVAVTVGFTALGAYLGRDLSGGTGLVLFIAAFALHLRPQHRRRQGPRAARDRPAVRARPAARARGRPGHRRLRRRPTRPPCGRRPEPPRRSSPRCGAYGYATRRDLSSWARTLFWALLGADRVRDRRDLRLDPGRQPHLRRRRARDLRRVHDLRLQPPAPSSADSAVPIAASIFLDIFNVFLLAARPVRRRGATDTDPRSKEPHHD